MLLNKEKLKELLVEPGHVTKQEFEHAWEVSENENQDIEDVILDQDLLRDEELGRVIAEGMGYRFLDLPQVRIDDEVRNMIPEVVARANGVIGVDRAKQGIRVGMRNPDDLEIIHFLEKKTGEQIHEFFITKQGFLAALSRYRTDLRDAFDRALKNVRDATLDREERDEIMVNIVAMILQYGHQNKASDIHIEPYRARILVRFRIDGVMHDVLDLPHALHDPVLTRIKILAKMRTDEHRAAQDGKFRFVVRGEEYFGTRGETDNEEVDVRVSIIPVTAGENVVMRLLSAKARQFNLSNLGFQDSDLQKARLAIKKPHGMILVTGPTGSGKTTTVYAILKILNLREVHIATIEDPVEYDIEGVSQIQVNPQTNLTFAKGLRAIVRQDPDIIMVGEIRDRETAGIAVNSAMTGHLVLSTLHANDAVTTLPRLLDMGVEPFLVASTVNIAAAQRLVRKICIRCRASGVPGPDEQKIIAREPLIKKMLLTRYGGKMENVILFKGKGCKVCADTGYAGRVGIFEILEMSENIKDLIVRRAASGTLLKAAVAQGMTTMLEDGISKVTQGITTLDEVLRVTKT